MAELTHDRLQELRRIAEAATPGPWRMHSEPEFSGPWSVGADHLSGSTVATAWAIEWSAEAAQANAQHIAAFDPTTVLALLDRIEALEAKQQIGRNLSVAAEQLVKAWDMNAPREDLQFLIDDLRQALFEFEGPLGDGGTAWLSIDDNGEAGGATHA